MNLPMPALDVISAIPVVISQSVIVWGVYRAIASLAPYRRFNWRLAATIVTVWSLIVVVSVLLSLMKLLGAVALHGTLFIVGAILLFAASNHSVGQLSAGAEGTARRPRRFRWIRLTGLMLSASIAVHIFHFGIGDFPRDWDSLAYHIPQVDHWINAGHLAPTNGAFWYVPGNGELLGHWFVCGFTGDFYIGLSNVPVLLLLGSSIQEWMVVLRVPAALRLIGAVSVLATQVVMRQVVSQENDMAVMALFASGLMFGWNVIERRDHRDVFLAAISIGLLSGIKYYALGYAVILVLGLVVFCSIEWGGRFGLRLLATILAACIVLGSYWYLRNWVIAGTPLFPKGFERLGMPNLWAEMRPGNELSSLWRGSTIERWKLLLAAWMTQAGPSSVATIIIASGLVVLGGWKGRLRYLLAALVGTILVYVNTPNVIESVAGTENMLRWQYHPVRFGGPLAVIAGVIVTVWLSQWRRGWPRTAAISFFAMLTVIDVVLCAIPALGWLAQYRRSIGWFANPYGYVPDSFVWIMATANIAIGWMILRSVRLSWGNSFSAIVAMGIVSAMCLTGWLSSRWHREFTACYDGWLMRGVAGQIEDRLTADETLVVCAYRYYPLLRSDRSMAIHRPLYLPTEESFLQYVSRVEASYVLALQMDDHETKTYANVPSYLEGNKSRFTLVEHLDSMSLYRVHDDLSER